MIPASRRTVAEVAVAREAIAETVRRLTRLGFGADLSERFARELRAWLLEPGATIAGRLVDGSSRAPLQGAAVTVLTDGGAPPRPEAATGADGRFRLTGLPAGVRRLRLAAPGYRPAEREAEVEPLAEVDLGDVALEAVGRSN